MERLAARETELRDAQAASEHLDGLEIGTEPVDEVALLEELVRTIKALRDTLDGDPARSRQVVKRLLQTPVSVGRVEADGSDLQVPGVVPGRPAGSGRARRHGPAAPERA